MFNTRSLSPTTQKSADSSTYWQFFYYRPPGKFRLRSLKISCQEPNIYRYYRYKQFDNRYGFSISIGNTNVICHKEYVKRWLLVHMFTICITNDSCFVVDWCKAFQPISFRVASLYDRPSTSEATLKDMGKQINLQLIDKKTTTKFHNALV